MPKIYDFNGSVATEIKKIYDWNGSAATQIKNGYDWNGSAASRVYQYQSVLYGWNYGNTGYAISKRTQENGSVNTSTFTASAQPPANNRSYALAWVTLNFTGYNTLTINYTYYDGPYTGGFVGYGTGFDTMTLTNSATFAVNSAYTPSESDKFVSGTLTWTANIASVTGNRHVGVMFKSNSFAPPANGYIKINYILLS